MSDFIMLKNVRVSFPHLFTKPIIEGSEGKCGCTLMLNPDDDETQIARVKKEIQSLLAGKFKGKKIARDKLCLREGDDSSRDEYEGVLILSANSKTFPRVIAANGADTIEQESDSKIYGGCYVNAKVRLWGQDNQYGKRINAELVAIQFHDDGEPLDGSYVSEDDAIDGFESAGNDAFANDEDDFLNAS